MPTGYTADLYKGKQQDFATFVLRCARAFGATIMQRDDDPSVLPQLREVPSYYADKLAEAERRVAEIDAWTDDDWLRECDASNKRLREARRQDVEKRAAIRERYEAMLAEVLTWQPPTPDHVGLRDFMVEQLHESIDFDCRDVGDFYRQQTVDEFRTSTLEEARRDVSYYRDEGEKERQRVAETNTWITTLYESLDAEVTA